MRRIWKSWNLYFLLVVTSCLFFAVHAVDDVQMSAQSMEATAADTNGHTSRSTSTAHSTSDSGTVPDHLASASQADEVAYEKILPNYKKVKKLNDEIVRSAEAPIESVDGHFIEANEVRRVHESRADDPRQPSDSVNSKINLSDDLVNSPNEGDHLSGKVNDDEVPSSVANSCERPAAASIVHDDSLQRHEKKECESLPNIRDIPPVVTVTELPLGMLEATRSSLDGLIMDAASKEMTAAAAAKEQENNRSSTVEMLENVDSGRETMPKDDEIIKFDDSGGNPSSVEMKLTNENIPNENATATVTTTTQTTTESAEQNITGSSDETAGLPPTDNAHQHQQKVEGDKPPPSPSPQMAQQEVPIQVFSEWAQKQMEAAEKQQAIEQQQVVSNSSQKKNNTNANGKAFPRKIRAKNYASPDCGAKIIAANADASNTGAVLSSSSDEYMLSQCGNRIWFVVELCEAIQAQKVELANFELFSSSPKNFTVGVANRFPTRDWSNVGRFVAEDKRTVQSFDLHPHLFGKFVRVDIHSHYSKEHFCPVSLFRVFGTSEFEALDTENHPHDDLDDFDDELALEQAHAKNSENIFKSASNAMFSIVKKAVEVVVKPVASLNQTQTPQAPVPECRTPAYGSFSCAKCNHTLVERINEALSCQFRPLQRLLAVRQLRVDLMRTRVCAKRYGIAVRPAVAGFGVEMADDDDCSRQAGGTINVPLEMDIKQSYYINLLPAEYTGALCQLLAEQHVAKTQNATKKTAPGKQNGNGDGKVALNLTIDKKLSEQNYKTLDRGGPGGPNKIISPPPTKLQTEDAAATGEAEGKDRTVTTTTATPSEENHHVTTERSSSVDEEQRQRPPTAEGETQEKRDETTTTTSSPAGDTNPQAVPSATGTASNRAGESGDDPSGDINIFNVPTTPSPLEQLDPVVTANGPSTTASSSESPQASAESSVGSEASGETSPPASSSPSPMEDQTTPMPAKSEEEVTTGSWENLDALGTTMASYTQQQQQQQQQQPKASSSIGGGGGGGVIGGPHSESVIIRLSNRIKALERNMSLSGQYLEELSRRYKKQVEELQQTLTQQSQTVRALEEQNRQQSELENMIMQRNSKLLEDLEDLTLQVHACIVVIIFVGGLILLLLITGIVLHRSIRRETEEMRALHAATTSANNGTGGKRKANNASAAAAAEARQRKLLRRKSFDNLDEHKPAVGQASPKGEKLRRPSEEVMMILKECASDSEAAGEVGETKSKGAPSHQQQQQLRQRKISVCYGSGHCNQKRKGEKHSWPNSKEHMRQQQSWNGQENGNSDDSRAMLAANKSAGGGGGAKSRKKSQQHHQLKRQDSAPSECPSEHAQRLNASAPPSALVYDESLCLEEDDLDNFIPHSDMAYNEFMPEGPSGYQIVQDDNAVITAATGAPAKACKPPAASTQETSNASKPKSKKSRRLSSSGIFKSPFSKNSNRKASNASVNGGGNSNPAHESTSWEWKAIGGGKKYGKQHQQQQQQQKPQQQQLHLGFTPARIASDAASIDSSSLSEVHFDADNSSNRILREAILSSGEEALLAMASLNGKPINGQCSRSSSGSIGIGSGGGAGARTGGDTPGSSSCGSGRGSGSGLSSNRSNSTSSSNASTKKKRKLSLKQFFRKVT